MRVYVLDVSYGDDYDDPPAEIEAVFRSLKKAQQAVPQVDWDDWGDDTWEAAETELVGWEPNPDPRWDAWRQAVRQWEDQVIYGNGPRPRRDDDPLPGTARLTCTTSSMFLYSPTSYGPLAPKEIWRTLRRWTITRYEVKR